MLWQSLAVGNAKIPKEKLRERTAEPAGLGINTQGQKMDAINVSKRGKRNRKSNPLLIMLAAIFGVQMTLFIGSTIWCMNDHMQHCDEVGRRYDETFGTAIATVLALMHGGVTK